MEQQDREKPVEFDPSRFFESFAGVGKELIFRPKNFFRQLPLKGNLKNPFVFLVICTFFSSLFVANLINGGYNLFFALLFANTLSVFMGSFVFHNSLVSKIFGSNVPFAATFCITAYASLMDIAAWIPALGLLANFYGFYLIYIGFQEIHQLKSRQAVAAVISIVLIIGLLRICIISMTAGSWIEGIKLLDFENKGF